MDEIENGLHHSVMSHVWEAISEFARRLDVQIMATTHSWECIVAAHTAFERQEEYDFRLYRLEQVDGQIQATAYDQDTLAAAITSDTEVR